MSDNIFSSYLIGEEKISESKIPETVISPVGKKPVNHGELFPVDIKKKKKDIKIDDPGEEKSSGPGSEFDFSKSDEYKSLNEQAQKAQLMKHIQVDKLNRLKLETEMVNFKKAAGEVAEFKFMELMYTSYITKMHTDIIKMLKRLKPKLESYIRDPEAAAAISLLLKTEVKKTLEGVKIAQIKEVEKWNQE